MLTMTQPWPFNMMLAVDDNQTRITLFDNGPTDTIRSSRGLLFAVDQSKMTVKLINQFYKGAQMFSEFDGCTQAINSSDENTNFFLDYGNQSYFAELDKDAYLLDVQFGATNIVNSYGRTNSCAKANLSPSQTSILTKTTRRHTFHGTAPPRLNDGSFTRRTQRILQHGRMSRRQGVLGLGPRLA